MWLLRLRLRKPVLCAVLSAFMVKFFPALWLDQMPVLTKAGVSLDEVRALSPLLAMFMLSSGAGKLTALLNGPAAISCFCRLNLPATSCLVAMCCVQHDLLGAGTWLVFWVAYAYFGFFDRDSGPAKEKDTQQQRRKDMGAAAAYIAFSAFTVGVSVLPSTCMPRHCGLWHTMPLTYLWVRCGCSG